MRASCGWREYVVATARTAAVLAIGIPWACSVLAYYWLRKVIFHVPMQGDWGERGQCEAWRKGPNTWQ